MKVATGVKLAGGATVLLAAGAVVMGLYGRFVRTRRIEDRKNWWKPPAWLFWTERMLFPKKSPSATGTTGGNRSANGSSGGNRSSGGEMEDEDDYEDSGGTMMVKSKDGSTYEAPGSVSDYIHWLESLSLSQVDSGCAPVARSLAVMERKIAARVAEGKGPGGFLGIRALTVKGLRNKLAECLTGADVSNAWLTTLGKLADAATAYFTAESGRQNTGESGASGEGPTPTDTGDGVNYVGM